MNQDWINAIILGIVQGITEFIPVSSSGHIVIANALFPNNQISEDENLFITVILHLATTLSTILYFWKDIKKITIDTFKPEIKEGRNFILNVLISMIPVGIVGFLFKDVIESYFEGSVKYVGFFLLINATLLFLTSYKFNNKKEIDKLSSFIIGCIQAVAILPGISRAGSTISVALLLGIKRENATKFSFLMLIPVVLGINFIEIVSEYKEIHNMTFDIWKLLVSFLISFILGYLSCKLITKIVISNNLKYFAIYCFVVGTLCLIVF